MLKLRNCVTIGTCIIVRVHVVFGWLQGPLHPVQQTFLAMPGCRMGLARMEEVNNLRTNFLYSLAQTSPSLSTQSAHRGCHHNLISARLHNDQQ